MGEEDSRSRAFEISPEQAYTGVHKDFVDRSYQVSSDAGRWRRTRRGRNAVQASPELHIRSRPESSSTVSTAMPYSPSDGTNRLSWDTSDGATSSGYRQSADVSDFELSVRKKDSRSSGEHDGKFCPEMKNRYFGISKDISQRTLHDMDDKLNQLSNRMQAFEANLCDTVDNILLLLGHKPALPRYVNSDNFDETNQSEERNSRTEPVNPDVSFKQEKRSATRKGPRLVKSPEDLAKLLEKM